MRASDPSVAGGRVATYVTLVGFVQGLGGAGRTGGLLGVRRQDQRWARRLREVEVGEQVAERGVVLAHVGPRVRAPVGGRVEPLPAEEVVLDELQVGVERQRLVIDGCPAWRRG